MNAPPPADKAPPADAVSKGYEEKAAKARGSKKINDKLEAVGRIGETISAEVQKVMKSKYVVWFDETSINFWSNVKTKTWTDDSVVLPL